MTDAPLSEILSECLSKKQYELYEKEKMRWIKRDIEKMCKQMWKASESHSYRDKLIAVREGWLADAQKQVDKITKEIDDIKNKDCEGFAKSKMKRIASLLSTQEDRHRDCDSDSDSE